MTRLLPKPCKPQRTTQLVPTVCTSFFVLTRHTLVRKAILVAGFFSLPGYRYLGDGDADRREIFQDGTYRSRIDLLPFLGRYSLLPGISKSETLGQNFDSLTTNVAKTWQRYISIRARQGLSKNVSHRAVAFPRPSPGSAPPIWRVCLADALVKVFIG